ncbi:unnamed protein product, partial [Choristocarpus tenellus]
MDRVPWSYAYMFPSDRKSPQRRIPSLFSSCQESNNAELICGLLMAGANVNEVASNGWTPLHAASSNCLSDNVLMLLKWGADPNRSTWDGTTPLLLAVKYIATHDEVDHVKALKTIEILLGCEADVGTMHHRTIDEYSAQYAEDARLGRTNVLHYIDEVPRDLGIDVLDLLLQHSCGRRPINAKDELGRTPLNLACASKRVEAAIKLITKGAHVETRDRFGNTPLHLSVSWDKEDLLVPTLIKAGAPLNARRWEERWTPLHLACKYENVRAVTALLDAGADASKRAQTGLTALQLAVKQGKSASVCALLEWGLRPPLAEVKGGNGKCWRDGKMDIKTTPKIMKRIDPLLIMAAAQKCTKVVKLLLGAGCDVNCSDERGYTALHHAAGSGWSSNVMVLVEAGA